MTETIQTLDLFCEKHLTVSNEEKPVKVDTYLHTHELNRSTLKDILLFGPYGESNPEPVFMVENSIITTAQKVGKSGNGHLKLQIKKEENVFTAMQRGKGDTLSSLPKNQPLNLIGKVKEDTFSGGRYLDTQHILLSNSPDVTQVEQYFEDNTI
ncbi:MAG: hypothetical protein Q8O99_01090 [bacterium]|nr:hypothetical protein [bacterium]